MGDLREHAQEAVHTRTITTTTYSVDEDHVLLEGSLQDRRLKEACGLTSGERRKPGIVHDLKIRLLVNGRDLCIEDVEVRLDHVPHEDCRQTRESLRPLIGRKIEPGFSMWVRNTFGGPKGCAHLNALLLAMASAAVQGLWTHWASRADPSQKARNLAAESRYLIDTCWPWRKDGPRARKLLEESAKGT